MAKPAVTLRQTKGSALTYAELDTNFTNLKDATLTLTGGTGGTQVTADLNGTITLVAGTGITLTGDNSAKTITIAGADSMITGEMSLNPTAITISSTGIYNYSVSDYNMVYFTNSSGGAVTIRMTFTPSAPRLFRFILSHSGVGNSTQFSSNQVSNFSDSYGGSGTVLFEGLYIHNGNPGSTYGYNWIFTKLSA